MNETESKAVLTLALLAAFADGAKYDREREAVRKVAEALGVSGTVDLPQLYRDVLIGKPELATVAAQLQSVEARQLAFEMAVGVCDADGRQTPDEGAFLTKLAAALGLPADEARAYGERADQIADSAVDEAAAPAAGAAAAASAPAAASGTLQGKTTMTPEEHDKVILNAAITNAALELLPESIASMAIIPLQMRLVYRIGQSYGYPMDMSNAKDFIATLGIGLTGQYIEQFGRKLLGGLLGGIGRQAASSGMSFATTYALGRVAQRYYAAGRTIDTATLKETFTSMVAEARGLAPRYQAEIEQKAQTIDTRQLASLVRQV